MRRHFLGNSVSRISIHTIHNPDTAANYARFVSLWTSWIFKDASTRRNRVSLFFSFFFLFSFLICNLNSRLTNKQCLLEFMYIFIYVIIIIIIIIIIIHNINSSQQQVLRYHFFDNISVFFFLFLFLSHSLSLSSFSSLQSYFLPRQYISVLLYTLYIYIYLFIYLFIYFVLYIYMYRLISTRITSNSSINPFLSFNSTSRRKSTVAEWKIFNKSSIFLSLFFFN